MGKNSALNLALAGLVEKKNKLSTLSYDDKKYDDIEEELHDLEDEFLEEYGDFLEERLDVIHQQLKSDAEVLLPIAYTANRYTPISTDPDGTVHYEVNPGDGVLVDSEKYPDKPARIVMMPNPVRFVLMINNKVMETLWKEE